MLAHETDRSEVVVAVPNESVVNDEAQKHPLSPSQYTLFKVNSRHRRKAFYSKILKVAGLVDYLHWASYFNSAGLYMVSQPCDTIDGFCAAMLNLMLFK